MQYSEDQNREELADYFARCLLMPKPRFIHDMLMIVLSITFILTAMLFCAQ